MAMSFEEIRRRILVALFSDDLLLDTLVLKGGNALALVHKVGSRASLDMDFSVQEAFSELDKIRDRIFGTLKREFETAGYIVFDEKLDVKPSRPPADQPKWWGGYRGEFKLASKATYEKFKHDLESLRRNSEVLGPSQQRKYTIDISHNEFCEGKVQREVDDYVVYVYSLEMIAAEKLRAICQQMPEYPFNRKNKSARARDFYDIHQIIVENDIDLAKSENLLTLAAIFEAKQVPLDLLGKIGGYKDFHALDWPSVAASISGKHESFDFYFDYVVELAAKLKAFRKK
jgi:predicted nucleotidyltransferase component of viral defense system